MNARQQERQEIKNNLAVVKFNEEACVLKPNASPEDLDTLSSYVHFPSVLIAVARHKNTSVSTLTKLTDIANELNNHELLIALQANPRLPLKQFKMLALDEFLTVECLIAVASCPRLPDEQIKKLAKHENRSVRVAVAHNPSCPKDVLKELFNSGRDEEIDYAVACNPSCPEALHLALSLSPDFKTVLEVAKQTRSEDVFLKILRRSKRINKEWRHKLQMALVKNKNFDSCFLEQMDFKNGFDWDDDEELEKALVDRGVIEDK